MSRQGEAKMDYRQLGNSGLKVSALTLGTMTIGGPAAASPRSAMSASPTPGG